MFIHQHYTGCLAEAAYYIESDGIAAVIDPMRDSAYFIELARQRQARIAYILETHFHADFVSGHMELATATGAAIVFGPGAQPSFPCRNAADGERIALGSLTIEVLHTPGHTLESSCFLLRDANDAPHALFTGDTLFMGDVGRPDLAAKGALSKEDLAGLLYDSLHTKILTLPDSLLLYPGHGSGSACGKNLGCERFDTLGSQRVKNYALRIPSRQEFITTVSSDLPPPPAYFPFNVALNKAHVASLADTLAKASRPLLPADLAALPANTVLLDVRPSQDFLAAHLKGSLWIGLQGQFASWVGSLLADPSTPVALICLQEQLEEAATRLARIGFDHIEGHFASSMPAAARAGLQLMHTPSSDPSDYLEAHSPQDFVLDVRSPAEFTASHLAAASHIPLPELAARHHELPADTIIHIHCQGGYRSVIACSILERAGLAPERILNLEGGFLKLKALGFQLA